MTIKICPHCGSVLQQEWVGSARNCDGNSDMSKFLLQDKNMRESIESAKDEMKHGGPYFNHDEVFGEG